MTRIEREVIRTATQEEAHARWAAKAAAESAQQAEMDRKARAYNESRHVFKLHGSVQNSRAFTPAEHPGGVNT